jgi:hypothetical protein
VTIATNMAGRGTDIKLGAGVADLGGLHILGTERHESRRIDRQLRGRAGRQGDPGSSRFFLSLEDDLMRLFGAERISGLMQKMGVEEGEVIEHGMVTSAIGRAQKRVEAHNFDIRKHLLEYDNVMNKQREEVYRQRDEALLSQDISARVRDDLRDVVAERVERYADDKRHRAEWNMRGLADELAYLCMSPAAVEDVEGSSRDGVHEAAATFAEKAYRARETQFGEPVMRDLERHLYLFTLDEHWREHLHELDYLKGGIGLQAYGQRDPLVQYKKEAFTLFETMMGEVREDVVQRLFRVQVQPAAARQVLEEAPRVPRQMVAQHAAGRGVRRGSRARRRGPRPRPHAPSPRERRLRPHRYERCRASAATTRARAAAARSTRSATCPRTSSWSPDHERARTDGAARVLRIIARKLEEYLEGDDLALETLAEALEQEGATPDEIQSAVMGMRGLAGLLPPGGWVAGLPGRHVQRCAVGRGARFAEHRGVGLPARPEVERGTRTPINSSVCSKRSRQLGGTPGRGGARPRGAARVALEMQDGTFPAEYPHGDQEVAH